MATKRKRKEEYRIVGNVTMPLEVSVKASSLTEAILIATKIAAYTDAYHTDRVEFRVGPGERSRVLKSRADFLAESGHPDFHFSYGDVADEQEKELD